MAFEVFTKRMVPLVQSPYVTVQKRGTISMNKASHHLLGEPDAVELLYDRAARKMGFRAVAREAAHAYVIRPAGGGRPSARGLAREETGTFVVSGTAFFKFYEIDTTVSRRWPAALEDDVLVLDLSTEGTVVTSNRNGRTKATSEPDSDDGLWQDDQDSRG